MSQRDHERIARLSVPAKRFNFRAHPVFGTNGVAVCCFYCGRPMKFVPLGVELHTDTPVRAIVSPKADRCSECEEWVVYGGVCVVEVSHHDDGPFPHYTGRRFCVERESMSKNPFGLSEERLRAVMGDSLMFVTARQWEEMKLSRMINAVKRGLPNRLSDWTREDMEKYLEERGFAVSESESDEALKEAVLLDLEVE